MDNIKEALNSVMNAQKNYRKLIENVSHFMPSKMNLPNFHDNILDTKNFVLPPNQDVIREKNSWERHGELLDVQNSVLKVQTEILKEQKSTSKMTLWVLGITVVSLIVSIVSIIF